MNDTHEVSRQVFEQLHDDAFKWALSCCAYDHEEAQDVMQSVYVEIISGKAVFRGESSLRTWLFAVIRRQASRTAYAQGLVRTLKSKVKNLRVSEMAGQALLEVFEGQERSTQIRQALSTLSFQQRQIIELVYYRDFTLVEAAQIMGVGLGSARTHFHRAKQALARQLETLEK